MTRGKPAGRDVARADREGADGDERRRETEAERGDQDEPEGRPADRDRAEEDDERARRRQDPSRERERDEAPPGERSCRMRMVVSMPAPLRERVEPRDEQGGAETEGDEAGGEPQPRIDAFGREERSADRTRRPRPSTDAVCITETAAPTAAACRSVPPAADQVRADQ